MGGDLSPLKNKPNGETQSVHTYEIEPLPLSASEAENTWQRATNKKEFSPVSGAEVQNS